MSEKATHPFSKIKIFLHIVTGTLKISVGVDEMFGKTAPKVKHFAANGVAELALDTGIRNCNVLYVSAKY
jgi:hypothetical protein